MLVSVFETESGAYDGTRALRELDAEGTFSIYATAVIAKDQTDKISVKQAVDQGPLERDAVALKSELASLKADPF